MIKTYTKTHGQFKYYTFLSVVYATLMITAQAVAYRLILVDGFTEPGGIFIFPATFALSDVIAEVYGPTLARRSIFIALFSQIFYSLIPMGINSLPYPETWGYINSYKIVFGSSWLVFISNLIAVTFGMVLNTQLIGKTKIMTHGRFFSLRSLCSSAIGEFVLTAIIVAIALVPVEGSILGIKLFVNMFVFKMAFSILAVYPASLLVILFKKLDNADIYEEKITLNPLSIFIKKPTDYSAKIIDLFEEKKKKKITS